MVLSFHLFVMFTEYFTWGCAYYTNSMQPNDSVTDVAVQVGSLLCRNGRVGHERLQYQSTAWSNASAEVSEQSNWLSLLVPILITYVDIINVFHRDHLPHNIEKLNCHSRQKTSSTYKFIYLHTCISSTPSPISQHYHAFLYYKRWLVAESDTVSAWMLCEYYSNGQVQLV